MVLVPLCAHICSHAVIKKSRRNFARNLQLWPKGEYLFSIAKMVSGCLEAELQYNLVNERKARSNSAKERLTALQKCEVRPSECFLN